MDKRHEAANGSTLVAPAINRTAGGQQRPQPHQTEHRRGVTPQLRPRCLSPEKSRALLEEESGGLEDQEVAVLARTKFLVSASRLIQRSPVADLEGDP